MHKLADIKEELSNGADKNKLLENLMKCSRPNDTDLFCREKYPSIAYLLEIGADPNMEIAKMWFGKADNKLNVLEYYIDYHYELDNVDDINLLIVKLFLEYGGKVTTYSLFVCASNGFDTLIKILFEAGVDVNGYDAEALKCAVRANQLKTVELLIELGSNVNSRTNHPLEKLKNSFDGDTFEIAKLLITHGSVPNLNDNYSLLSAIRFNLGLKIVALLVNSGADVNARDGEIIAASIVNNIVRCVGFNESNVTIKYIEKGQYDVLKFLIERGADLNKFQDKIFESCCKCYNEKIFDLLHDCNFDFFAGSACPLDQAAMRNNIILVKKLLEIGADPNWCHGAALLTAVGFAHNEILALLIKYGASIKLVDQNALKNKWMFSHAGGITKTLEILIDAGYDLSVINPDDFAHISKPSNYL